jgi:transposase-like protein
VTLIGHANPTRGQQASRSPLGAHALAPRPGSRLARGAGLRALRPEAARRHYEASRWPNGPVCPRCGVVGNSVELKGKSTRPGVYNCRDCDKPFTATIGTIFERSHIPMHKWLLAIRLLSSSKKGMSAHQLWRMLGFGSYRTAWFMSHRIRESVAGAASRRC